jgi:2-C-methyl-D-erythritol 2,4-cyclodiphosphate synthase
MFVMTLVGLGFDIHRLEKGRRFVAGGIVISEEIGPVAHSDGDVLLHALCDALLGAVGAGDIGEHFPDTDMQWKGISSMKLLHRVLEIVAEQSGRVQNIDATLVLEKPKILPFKQAIRASIAEACRLPLHRVSLKATTNEKLDDIGAQQGVAAYCVCTVVVPDDLPIVP